MATVLIVEDETVLLILAESVVRSARYETLTASTLSQAQAVMGSAEHMDLVFTDICLGDDQEAGIHVGQLVRQLRPQTPVLYTKQWRDCFRKSKVASVGGLFHLIEGSSSNWWQAVSYAAASCRFRGSTRWPP